MTSAIEATVKPFSYSSLGEQVQKITHHLYNDPLYPLILQITLPRITGTLIHSIARITDCALTLLVAIGCTATAVSYQVSNLVHPIQDCKQITDQLFERAEEYSGLFFVYLLDIPTCWVFNLINLQAYQSFYVEDTTSWIATPISPIPGFKNKNLVNCAFNSCLQVILHHPEWRDIYEVVAKHYNAKTEKDKICGENMLAVLHAYDTALTTKKSIPAEISHKLRLATHHLNPLIAGDCSQQEDAHEIFVTLVGKYEEILEHAHLREPTSEPQGLSQEEKSKLISSYQQETLTNSSPIHFKNTFINHYEAGEEVEIPKNIPSTLNENNTLVKEGVQWQLKIELEANKKPLTFDELLQRFFNKEEDNPTFSENSPKLLKGEKCFQVKLIKEELEFSKKPNYLAIQFARFSYDKKGCPSKIHAPIANIPEQLDASALSIKNSPSGTYELTSFITHSGSTNGGHYIAYLKKQAGWIKCNDETTSYATESDVSQDLSNSYMCFYKLKTEQLSLS